MNTLSLLSLLVGFPDGGIPGGAFSYAIGARPSGLGRAFTGLADDIETIYFNPAGLATLQRKNIMGGMYWMPKPANISSAGPSGFDAVNFQFGAISFPSSTYGAFGVAVIQLDPPDLIVYTDSAGTATTDITNVFRGGIFTYSKSFARTLSIGVNLKVLFSRIGYNTAGAAGADLGMLFKPNDAFSIGIAGLNFIPPRPKFAVETVRYPQIWRFGIGLKPMKMFTFTIDAEHSSHYQNFHFYGGVEAHPLTFLYVRGGANYDDISGGGGFEFTIRDLVTRIDFTYSWNHASKTFFEETQQISLTTRFGGYRVWANADPKLISPNEGDVNLTYIYLHSFARQMIDEWTFVVRKQSGETVRVYQGEGDPPVRIEWDARDDSGRIAPSGNYYYNFEVIDVGGEAFERGGFLCTVKKAEVW